METLPIAVIAFTASFKNIFQLIEKNNKTEYVVLSIFLFYLISSHNVFSILIGFSSPGFNPLMKAIFLFTIFYLVPFENMNSKILKCIDQMTKFTPGIYCLHGSIMFYVKIYFDKKSSFFRCIFLYIICYFISFIGFKAFSKNKLKYLFM